MTGSRRPRAWVLWCLGAYVAAIAIVVLTPVSYARIVGAIDDALRSAFGLTWFGAGWVEFAGNVLLFVPLGFLLTLLFARPWVGVLLALALSVAAEVAQIVIPSRHAALRDVIANVTGAAIGALLAAIIVRRRRRLARRRDAAATAAPAG